MAVVDAAALAEALAPRACLMGLDLGTKTIGVAVSDDGRAVATPLETVRRGRLAADAARLLEIAADYGIGGIVAGLPVNMDGSEGPRCQSARRFAAALAEETDLPIVFWDERWSTRSMERHLIAQDVSRRRRRQVIDKLAAQFILQGFLDLLRNRKAGPA